MKLARRTVYSTALAIFLAAAFVLFGGVALLTRYVILTQVAEFEVQDTAAVTKRFEFDLRELVVPAEMAASDWSAWTDLSAFASGVENEFIERHVAPGVLKNLRIDFLAVLDAEGRLRGLSSSPTIPLSTSRLESSLQPDTLHKEGLDIASALAERKSGFILLSGQLAVIATAPIATSGTSDSSSGILITGRIIGNRLWNELLARAGARGVLYSADANLPTTFGEERFKRILASRSFHTEVKNSDEISSYLILRAINGDVIGVAELTLDRVVYRQGLGTVTIFITTTTLAGALLVFVVWWLLHRTILARITLLKRKLDEAREQGRLPVRLNFPGHDELTDLATSVEGLAGRIEDLQEQYRAVVEDQTEMIARFSPELGLLFANGAFLRFFELDEAPIRLVFLKDLIWPEDWPSFRDAVLTTTAANPSTTIQHRVRQPDHSPVWLRSTIRRNFFEDGTPGTMQWIAADVTAEREAQQKMAESEVRFRSLFEAAKDGFLLAEEDSNEILDANKAFLHMLRKNKEAVVGRPLKEALPFLDAKEIQSFLHPAEEKNAPRKGLTCTLVLADSSTLRLEVTASPFSANHRRLVLLLFRDISELVRNERELRELSLRLMHMQDEERRRIARELHDSTAQNLSALEMNISLLEPLVAPDQIRATRILAESRRIARECSNELRNISYLLHPPLLDEVGLVFAVKWFADGYTRRTGIQVDLNLEDRSERMPTEIEMTLFRVVQEGLSNIYRHSEASRAKIELSYTQDGKVCLEISDNGRGLQKPSDQEPSEKAAFGVGLAGMRERLKQLGGSFEILSSSSGMHLRACIKLSKNHANPENTNPHRR